MRPSLAWLARHPAVSWCLGALAYVIAYNAAAAWLVRHFGENCHWVLVRLRSGPTERVSCSFDIAPAVDWALELLVIGGPLLGPLVLLTIVGLPVAYVVAGIGRVRSNLQNPSAPDLRPPSPYGPLKNYAATLRKQGVPEPDIAVEIAKYRDVSTSEHGA